LLFCKHFNRFIRTLTLFEPGYLSLVSVQMHGNKIKLKGKQFRIVQRITSMGLYWVLWWELYFK